jgi:conjugal transfer/type IV secretion protein DotA/TraY
MAQSPQQGQSQSSKARMAIQPKAVAGYLLLPRILPRFAELFFSGFTYFAYFMAQIYRSARLLPAAHPYLNASNIGAFGVRDVIAAAGSHLVFRKENIDQIIIFFAILLGLVLLAIQALIFLMMLATPEASAQSVAQMFGTPLYQGVAAGGAAVGSSQDLAFIMMDRVFGVSGIFNSCISLANQPCYGVNPQGMAFDINNPAYKPDGFPWPYHRGLHAMFAFYSTALLLVGGLIIIYYAIVVVVETAQTGTPFGKRFNTVWAPIRLVIALGLLIPIGTGLNSAQYITLYVAKFGSNFASNGWLEFNGATQGAATNLANGNGLVVEPGAPEVTSLTRYMIIAHACKALEEVMVVPDYTPDEDRIARAEADIAAMPTGTDEERAAKTAAENNLNNAKEADAKTCSKANPNVKNFDDMNQYRHIDAYLVKSGWEFNGTYQPLIGTSYEDAMEFSRNGDVKIVIGDQSCRNVMMPGHIAPLCGEIVLPSVALDQGSGKVVQEGYYNLIQFMWGGYGATKDGELAKTYTNVDTKGRTETEKNLCDAAKLGLLKEIGSGNSGGTSVSGQAAYTSGQKDKKLRVRGMAVAVAAYCNEDQKAALASFLNTGYTDRDLTAIGRAYREGSGTSDNETLNSQGGLNPVQELTNFPQIPDDLIVMNIIRKGTNLLQEEIRSGQYNISPEAMARGWAAAGIWYNKIAQMNGSLTGAAWSFPRPTKAPRLIQIQAARQSMLDNAVIRTTQLSGDDPMASLRSEDRRAIDALETEIGKLDNAQEVLKASSGNVFGDIINNLFGLDGLFNMRSPMNKNAHPLAQLVGVGKGLIEASIRNLTAGVAFGGLGIFTSGISGVGGGLGKAAEGVTGIVTAISGLMFNVATITLTAGFILYYVVPFLPFLYFFFAVGNWLKGVFEAMVGVPLWALAHLRIDGDGLPGEAAINGYFMLFEIFLRPILIIFGLLASVTIFAAMGAVLNDVYDTVVQNLTGANPDKGAMSSVDNLFYTIMYAVIMYMMALSSFKLIDLIPNQIMRWMGTNVSTFSDMAGDPAQTLTQYTAIAGSQIVGQVTQGTQSFMSGMQGAARSGVAGAAAMRPQTPPG